MFDTNNPSHRAVEQLLVVAARTDQIVHKTRLDTYALVQDAGVDEVQALLAGKAAVRLLDECTRTATKGCVGITTAQRSDFPRYMHDELEGAVLFRHFRLPGAPVRSQLPLLAVAFRPDGQILTVNEPNGESYLNRYGGVRDAQ